MTVQVRKQTGIPWLGSIPSHWTVNYLGNVVSVAGGSTPSKEDLGFWNGTIPWVSPKDMKKDVIADSEDHVTELALRKTSLRIIPPPAVLMVIRGMILDHTVPVAMTTAPVTVNQDMKALRPRVGVVADYLSLFLRAMNEALLARVEEAAHGTKALRTDLWRKLPIVIPPTAEQRAIVIFLDQKTAAIDALIAKKERLIELLQEKRQALIANAVTKGLDPTVPMKDSGDNWIGVIPSRWRCVRMGYEARIGNGSTPNREEPAYWADDGFPWLNSAKVNEETVPAPDRFVTPVAMMECHLPRIPPGTLLMAITGEGQTRGRVAILTYEATISQHLASILLSSSLQPRFLLRQLQARYLWLRSESSGGGSTKAALTCEFLASVPVTIPPRAEQDRIVAYLDDVLLRLDGLTERLSRSAEILREYRQALITAAVTGQIDVSAETSEAA